jgi:hypothetical protein
VELIADLRGSTSIENS